MMNLMIIFLCLPTLTETKMNFKDRGSVINSYAQYILDSLDMDAVLNIAYDTLVENLAGYTNEELATEIVESYGEEWLEDHNVEVNESV